VVHFVYTGTEIKGYLNGALITTVAQPSVTITGTGSFRVGAYGDYKFLPTGGLLDEFRLYNRPLSDTEVASTWNIHLFPPTVTTQAATSVTQTDAVVHGTVTANYNPTTVTFDYGLTLAYGSSVIATPSPVTGSTPTPVTATISGLNPNTLYHFRAKGVSGAGTVTGGDKTFDLIPSPTITGPNSVCAGTGNHTYRTQSGKANYAWTISAGGTITAGGSSTSDTVRVTWNAAGARTVSVNYQNSMGISAPSPTVYPVTVNPLPVPTISPTPLMTESFENGGSIPAGWKIDTIAPDNALTFPAATSHPSGYNAYNGTYLVRFNSYDYGNGVIRLKRTTPISTVGCTSVNVDFAWLESSAYSSSNDRVEVEWSLNGTTWNSAGTFPRYNAVEGWKIKTQPLPLSAGGQATLYIAFKFTSEFGNDCYLDLAKVYLDNSAVCVGSSTSYQTESGMTAYGWTLSSGGTITSGSGTASITILWSTAGSKTVGVNYTNSNGCKANVPTTTSTTVYALPAPTISGPTSACTYDTGFYRTQKNMTSYLWTVSTGGTINGSATDSVVNVTWTSAGSGGSRWLKVTYTNPNGCSGTSASFNVTVNPVPLPTISGPDSLCRNTVGTYQTQPAMTGYSWVVSPGGVILAGQSTKTLTVRWDSAGARSVSVNYTNASGCDAPIPTVLPVIVHPLPVPTLTGPDSVCATITGNTYITEVGMTGYQWTVSPDGVKTAGGTTTSNFVTVTWNNNGNKTVSVSYTNTKGCTPITPTVFPVLVSPLPVPQAIGPTTVCAQSTGHIYSTLQGMTSYTWSVSPGGTITSPTDSSAITVSWNSSGIQYVTVNYTTPAGCTGAIPGTLPVTVYTRPSPTISGPVSVCEGTGGHIYTTEPMNTAYQWTLSGGGTIVAGSGTNVISVAWDSAGSRQVLVNYTNSFGCNALTPTSYAVTVKPRPVPTITGPTPVCKGIPGNQYTTESGMLNYIWNVSAGNTIQSGGTTGSNFIVITWNVAGTQYVWVNYTSPNGCTAQTATFYPVKVNTLPAPTVGGPDTVCVSATGNRYGTQPGMFTYTWGISPGGTITSGTGTDTITVTWTLAGVRWVSVNYNDSNGCTATAPFVYNVQVLPLPVPTITGPASVCEGSSGKTYTTQSGMTNYQWVVSAGGTITDGGSDSVNFVTVTWDSAGVQTVSVAYTNAGGCTSAPPSVYNVTVNPLPVPTITGEANVCVNSGSYTYTTESGMTGYQWTTSASGIITSGQGTYQVHVTWQGTGSQWVGVIYTNGNGCTAATPSTLTVTVFGPPGQMGPITGTDSICGVATGISYTADSIANANSYNWTIPPGAVITSGAGTTSILVDYPESSSSGNVTVTASNACGNGPPSPLFPVSVTHPATPVISLEGNLLMSDVPAGNQWFLDGTAIPSANGPTYLAQEEGEYWDQVIINTCYSDTSNHIYVIITGIGERSEGSLILYPNPNNGKFTLRLVFPESDIFHVVILDMLGCLIYETTVRSENGFMERTLDVRPIPSGVYFVTVLAGNQQVKRKILVTP